MVDYLLSNEQHLSHLDAWPFCQRRRFTSCASCTTVNIEAKRIKLMLIAAQHPPYHGVRSAKPEHAAVELPV